MSSLRSETQTIRSNLTSTEPNTGFANQQIPNNPRVFSEVDTNKLKVETMGNPKRIHQSKKPILQIESKLISVNQNAAPPSSINTMQNNSLLLQDNSKSSLKPNSTPSIRSLKIKKSYPLSETSRRLSIGTTKARLSGSSQTVNVVLEKNLQSSSNSNNSANQTLNGHPSSRKQKPVDQKTFERFRLKAKNTIVTQKARITQLEKQISQFDQYCSTIKSQKEKLKIKLVDQLNKQQQEIFDIKTDRNKINEEIKKYQQQIQNLNEILQNYETVQKDRLDTISTLQTQNTQLESQLKSSRTYSTELTEKYEKKIKDLDILISQLEKKASHLEAQTHVLEEEKTDLRSEKINLTANQAHLEKENTKLKNTKNTLDRQHQQLLNESQVLSFQKIKLEEKVKSLADQLEQANLALISQNTESYLIIGQSPSKMKIQPDCSFEINDEEPVRSLFPPQKSMDSSRGTSNASPSTSSTSTPVLSALNIEEMRIQFRQSQHTLNQHQRYRSGRKSILSTNQSRMNSRTSLPRADMILVGSIAPPDLEIASIIKRSVSIDQNLEREIMNRLAQIHLLLGRSFEIETIVKNAQLSLYSSYKEISKDTLFEAQLKWILCLATQLENAVLAARDTGLEFHLIVGFNLVIARWELLNQKILKLHPSPSRPLNHRPIFYNPHNSTTSTNVMPPPLLLSNVSNQNQSQQPPTVWQKILNMFYSQPPQAEQPARFDPHRQSNYQQPHFIQHIGKRHVSASPYRIRFKCNALE